MAQIHESVATLRIIGDDLIPSEVSGLLGCAPTHSQKKGDVLFGGRTGIERVARTGMWRLHSSDQEPENLDKHVDELLSKLTSDLDIWRALGKKYRIDLFCGLFMERENEGLSISPSSLVALGQRGIELGLDIYGPSLDEG
jgi:hypothetical protein